MTTDRELLELAAKAAGLKFDVFVDGKPIRREVDGQSVYWNPLADDGDALRLATELRIDIRPRWLLVEAESGIGFVSEDCGDNTQSRSAATRRAIVRAAAAMGAK